MSVLRLMIYGTLQDVIQPPTVSRGATPSERLMTKDQIPWAFR